VKPALRHALLAPPALLCATWGLAAAAFTPVAPAITASSALAALILAASLARIPRFSRWLAIALAGLALGFVLRALPEPANDRVWMEPQSRLAEIVFEPERVHVRRVRDFRYGAGGTVTRAHWEDRSYELKDLESAWLGVSPFGGIPGVGHVFASFGFKDGRYLAVSVESRREQGESYSPVAGMYRAYELIYVLGDERDIVGLRANVWGDAVYLYPLRTSPEALRDAFLDILQRANALAAQPEFYDTVTSSCSSNLVRHVNRVVPGKVPGSVKALFAAWSDALAHEVGLLDFEGSLDEARARFHVNERAAGDVDAGDFSARIRSKP
jgi:hypothetical protein